MPTTTPKTLKQLIADVAEDGHVLWIAGTTIAHMMTGTSRVCVKPDGTICVTYTDGKQETRMACDALLQEMTEDNISVMSLVAYVQAGR